MVLHDASGQFSPAQADVVHADQIPAFLAFRGKSLSLQISSRFLHGQIPYMLHILRAQRQCQRMSRFETILFKVPRCSPGRNTFSPFTPGILSGMRYRLSPNARKPSPAVHSPALIICSSEKVSFAKLKYSAQSFVRFFAGIPFSGPVALTG